MNTALRLLIGLPLMIAMSDACAWTLVYSNDATGKTTYGSISVLINAIKQGQDVKILQERNGITSTICNEVFVSPDNSVACTMTQRLNTISLSPGIDFGFGDGDQAYQLYYAVNTRGQRNISRWLVGEHTSANGGQTKDTTALKWFIN